MIIISVHTSLEVLCKDIIANYLETHPECLKMNEIADLSLKVSALTSGALYQNIVRELKEKTSRKLCIFLKYREIIEKIVDVQTDDIPKSLKIDLTRFSATRNNIVHNNRKIDAQYLLAAPAENKRYKIGDELVISTVDFIQMVMNTLMFVDLAIVDPFIPKKYELSLKDVDFDFFEDVDPNDTVQMTRRLREWKVHKGRRNQALLQKVADGFAKSDGRRRRSKAQE